MSASEISEDLLSQYPEVQVALHALRKAAETAAEQQGEALQGLAILWVTQIGDTHWDGGMTMATRDDVDAAQILTFMADCMTDLADGDRVTGNAASDTWH